MTTLVTGASGFVGSAVARCLIDAGHQVRVLLRPESSRRNIAGLPLDVALGDLTDRASLERALAGCDALFHVAADYRLWIQGDPGAIYRANVDGTDNVMRAAAAAGVSRIVYTSSIATLNPGTDGEPGTEQTPAALDDMIGHYKRSKWQAEARVRQLALENRLPVVIVNPSAPVGPRDAKPTPTGRMILDAALGRMPCYIDTGLNLVHVDDVAQGHLLAYRHGRVGERYILGGQNLSLREILTLIARLCSRRPPWIRIPHGVLLPVAHVSEAWARLSGREPRVPVDGVRMARKHMYFSSEKARRELDYHARPVEAALADALSWFRTNGYLQQA
jgi:dihydroflavonol-4-reductase